MSEPTHDQPWLEELPYEVCLMRLREQSVGRLGIVVDEHPVVIPVNYRLVETSALTWVAIRTRPGNVVDRASMKAAFEIDGIDRTNKQGWSVLVRGMLQSVDPDAADFRERFDSAPWLSDRDAWFVIEPFSITGREIHATGEEWAFHAGAYL
jgi:nitroimidazol reductase NimA-like FMN-containing flavoprotein (pyridoxamine 5'-phosphate oxidase superfamily)